MIRNISLFFSMLILLIFQKIFTNDLSVTSKVPEKTAPGSEFIVELTVNKKDLKGFALLSQDLPEGFTATAIENKNASFTFDNQKVKFIWIDLPTEEEFIISYKVKVDSSATGEKDIAGSFSYLMNSDKKVYTIPTSFITVFEEELAQDSEENEETSEEGEKDSEENLVDNNSEVITESVKAEVKCKRNIDYNTNSKSEFVVEVVINKSEIGAFAKLQEILPNGFSATAVESNNAQFSFNDQMVKFVWMSLPEQNEFKVSYRVKRSPEIIGEYFVNGEFSYVEIDGETNKCLIDKEAIIIQPEEEIVADVIVENQQENIKEPNQESETANSQQAITSTPSPKQNGVSYKVQIAAGHTLVSTSYFVEKYSIKEQIDIEMHEGWNKYTIGEYPVYASAKENRETTTSNYKLNTGPFVTAYNNGQRITVQEALMISNQKWVK